MNFYLAYSELIACFSFLIPLAPGWILFNKLSSELRLFVIILSLSFIFSAAGYYTGIHYMHNLLLYFTQYLVQFYLYAILFRKLLQSRFSAWFIPVIMILFAAYVILHLKNLYHHTTTFDSYTPAFLSLAMIFYCILFFNRQLDHPHIIFIYKTPWFWIITGLLLYFSGSFIILLTTNYLMYRNKSFTNGLWSLQDLFSTIQNLLIATGFLFIKDKTWKM